MIEVKGMAWTSLQTTSPLGVVEREGERGQRLAAAGQQDGQREQAALGDGAGSHMCENFSRAGC